MRIISQVITCFDDGIYNLGRIEVWYVMSYTVHDRLPPNQRISLNTYFMTWMITFSQHLPDEKQRLQSIQESWKAKSLTEDMHPR